MLVQCWSAFEYKIPLCSSCRLRRATAFDLRHLPAHAKAKPQGAPAAASPAFHKSHAGTPHKLLKQTHCNNPSTMQVRRATGNGQPTIFEQPVNSTVACAERRFKEQRHRAQPLQTSHCPGMCGVNVALIRSRGGCFFVCLMMVNRSIRQ